MFKLNSFLLEYIITIRYSDSNIGLVCFVLSEFLFGIGKILCIKNKIYFDKYAEL